MSSVIMYMWFFVGGGDKEVELVGGGSVINGAYPVQFLHLSELEGSDHFWYQFSAS